MTKNKEGRGLEGKYALLSETAHALLFGLLKDVPNGIKT